MTYSHNNTIAMTSPAQARPKGGGGGGGGVAGGATTPPFWRWKPFFCFVFCFAYYRGWWCTKIPLPRVWKKVSESPPPAHQLFQDLRDFRGWRRTCKKKIRTPLFKKLLTGLPADYIIHTPISIRIMIMVYVSFLSIHCLWIFFLASNNPFLRTSPKYTGWKMCVKYQNKIVFDGLIYILVIYGLYLHYMGSKVLRPIHITLQTFFIIGNNYFTSVNTWSMIHVHVVILPTLHHLYTLQFNTFSKVQYKIWWPNQNMILYKPLFSRTVIFAFLD